MSEKHILEFESEKLTPQQVRLIKRIHYLLLEVTQAENEEKYFQTAAEALKECAALIKQSALPTKSQSKKIQYGDQALEFSIDHLSETMLNKKIITFDN